MRVRAESSRRRRTRGRHSSTARRARNMTRLLPLRLLCVLLAGALAGPAPAPGRVPKVYNALITSNQNLEPSKAYPVYQPVLHDTAFAYPFQPAVFYGGDFPLSNGLVPPLIAKPQQPSEAPQPSPSPPAGTPDESKNTDASPSQAPPAPAPSEDGGKASPAPPLPPSTQSPIPLNQFGLPSQVLPLGRFDPAFSGFTQVSPFTYNFPAFRFYDPYDPFSFSPYANLPPVYRPLTNVLNQGPPAPPKGLEAPVAPTVPTEQTAGQSTPPPEPSDLNLLNYSSKDPATPNVPPPPLPSGGSKSDSSE